MSNSHAQALQLPCFKVGEQMVQQLEETVKARHYEKSRAIKRPNMGINQHIC
jgi:hypothetical protein